MGYDYALHSYSVTAKGFAMLARMVRPGGRFYFSVPISARQRYEFNAHRFFSIPYLRGLFDTAGFDVAGFHYVDDADDLQTDQDIGGVEAAATFGLQNGCGIFELVKRRS